MQPLRYTQATIDAFVRDGYWTQETLCDFYARNARLLEEHEALIDSRQRLTWAEAAALADAIAQGWIAAGVPRDARVIIQAPNSVYGVLARVACERAGCISLGVTPPLREAEIKDLLAKTDAAVAVIPRFYRDTDCLAVYRSCQKRHPSLRHIYLFDDEALDGAASLPLTAQSYLGKVDPIMLAARRLDPLRDVALLTTTTGKADKRRIVEWPMAPLLCTAKARAALWQLTREDVTMAIAPHAGEVAGMLTYFAAPLVGAKSVMLEEFEPKRALAIMAKERVTAIGLLPSHLVRMRDQPVEHLDLSALRLIRSAGRYLSSQLVVEVEKKFGATMTNDLSTPDQGAVSGCRLDDPPELRRRTVGHPLSGNQLRLLSLDGRDAARGEPGVLCFRGPHAPAGYWRDEKLTASVFDPQGWCTTRDIATFDNGCLWRLGRAEDKITRAGKTIYPAEIEGLLNEHPAVAAAAVVGFPDSTYGERACAYVVPRGEASFGFADLTSFLDSRRLARYKFPERLEIVAALPTIGDSGRVNKRALRLELKRRLAALAQTRSVCAGGIA